MIIVTRFFTLFIFIVLVPLSVVSPLSALVSEKGLLAHWKLNEGSDTAILDSSGNQRNGAISGRTSWNTSVEPAQLYFDGRTASISISNSESLLTGAGFSISFKVKGGSDGTILSCWSNTISDRSYLIGIRKTGQLVFAISTDGSKSGVRYTVSNKRLNENKWYYCHAVADGQMLKLYIDGLYDSQKKVEYHGDFFVSDNKLTIGKSTWLGFFKGNLMDIKVYDRAFDFKEIIHLSDKNYILDRLGPLEQIIYFSFATPKYKNLSQRDLEIISSSRFDGICTRFFGAYERKLPKKTAFESSKEKIIAGNISKVWPLIFFNYFIGSPADQPCKKSNDKNHKNVRAMDIYDKTGTLTGFKNVLKLALSIAKSTNTPGIFIDPEAYSCYDAYWISKLTKRHKKSPEVVISRLKEIGGEFADICHSIYPEAIVYFYFIDFGSRWRDGYYTSIAYIIEGMLERAATKNYKFRIIDGWTGSYTYDSLNSVKHQVETKIAHKARFLSKYTNLDIAAVAAPFEDFSKLPKRSWIRKKLRQAHREGKLKISSINDFSNIYEYFFTNFRYVWIYGATEAGYPVGYDIFSPDYPKAYDLILNSELNRIRQRKN